MLSLNDLDVSKACEVAHEFEVLDEITGKGTGFFISVIGGHAQKILDFSKDEINARRVAEAMQEKRDPRGKNPQAKVIPVEKDIEFSTEIVALRIVGWRGITEPYSHENAVRLCTINPPIKEQILAVSEDLKNFPTPFPTSSTSMPATQPG
jgi:hypothetical protein